jgi:hypothetical protein
MEVLQRKLICPLIYVKLSFAPEVALIQVKLYQSRTDAGHGSLPKKTHLSTDSGYLEKLSCVPQTLFSGSCIFLPLVSKLMVLIVNSNCKYGTGI